MNTLPQNGYYIDIGGQHKMFTLWKKAPFSSSHMYIQNLAHTWEEAEAKAFEVTGFHLEAPACILDPLATQITRGDATMPYGKYRGRLVEDVVEDDIGYLVWWASRSKEFYESDPEARVKKIDKIIMELPEVTAELERRELARKEREAKWAAEKEAVRQSSRHLGTIGERIQFTGVITFTKSFENAYGIGWMTKVLTDDGCEVMYWNLLGLDAKEIGFEHHKLDGAKGDRVSFFAAVKDHGEYDGIKQTVVKRATKGKLLCPGEETTTYLQTYPCWSDKAWPQEESRD